MVWVRMSPVGSCIWTLGPNLMVLFGRFRRCGFAGGSMSLEVGHFQITLCCCLCCKLWALGCLLQRPRLLIFHDNDGLLDIWTRSPNKHPFSKLPCSWWFRVTNQSLYVTWKQNRASGWGGRRQVRGTEAEEETWEKMSKVQNFTYCENVILKPSISCTNYKHLKCLFFEGTYFFWNLCLKSTHKWEATLDTDESQQMENRKSYCSWVLCIQATVLSTEMLVKDNNVWSLKLRQAGKHQPKAQGDEPRPDESTSVSLPLNHTACRD